MKLWQKLGLILFVIVVIGFVFNQGHIPLNFYPNIHDLDSKEILALYDCDYSQYVTLPKNYKNLTITKYKPYSFDTHINNTLKDNPFYQNSKEKTIKKNDYVSLECTSEDGIISHMLVEVSEDCNLEPWGIYFGVPARFKKLRSKGLLKLL